MHSVGQIFNEFMGISRGGVNLGGGQPKWENAHIKRREVNCDNFNNSTIEFVFARFSSAASNYEMFEGRDFFPRNTKMGRFVA